MTGPEYNDILFSTDEEKEYSGVTPMTDEDAATEGDEQGMFELRGAVQFTVEKLGCSQASVYRYIKNAKAAEE